MTPTLDRSRDYGTIHGDHELGGQFAQDGFFYDGQGFLIEGAMDEVQVAKLAELRNQDEAVEQARAKFLELMPNADKATVDKLINVANLRPATTEEEIDLAAWAAGSKNYVFGKVTKAIREQFNVSPVNKLQCLEILAENGVIAPRSQTPTSPSL